MNASALRRIVEEDSESVSIELPLSGFQREHEFAPRNPRTRAIGLGLAALVHVLLIGGFLFAGPSISKVMPQDLVMIALTEPQEVLDQPPPPKLEQVRPPEVQTPEFVIDTPPPPTAITVAPPKPVVAAPAPSAGSNNSYFARLLSKLYSYKRYPEAARLKREKGIAVIRIVMERSGMVTSVALIKSSGSDSLDQEAINLPTRAQPLPAMPDSMTQERLTMNVNVDFTRIN